MGTSDRYQLMTQAYHPICQDPGTLGFDIGALGLGTARIELFVYVPLQISQLGADGTKEQFTIALRLFKSRSAGSDVVVMQRWAATEVQRQPSVH